MYLYVALNRVVMAWNLYQVCVPNGEISHPVPRVTTESKWICPQNEEKPQQLSPEQASS